MNNLLLAPVTMAVQYLVLMYKWWRCKLYHYQSSSRVLQNKEPGVAINDEIFHYQILFKFHETLKYFNTLVKLYHEIFNVNYYMILKYYKHD